METQEINKNKEDVWSQWEAEHKRGKILGGIFVVIVGALFLGRELGAEIPEWIFSWKTLIIGIGLFMGIKHRFRRWGWLIPVIVGGAFLVVDLYPTLNIKPLLWPILIILIGLIMIFKPRRKWNNRKWRRWQKHHNYKGENYNYSYDYKGCNAKGFQETTSDSDHLDFSVVFGNVKKNIISKDFKGGEMNIVMGGGELNLSQADINGTVRIEVNAVLGGARLVVPSNWTIKSDLGSVTMGTVEDKRQMNSGTASDPNKILQIEGDICMGGIEIRSF